MTPNTKPPMGAKNAVPRCGGQTVVRFDELIHEPQGEEDPRPDAHEEHEHELA